MDDGSSLLGPGYLRAKFDAGFPYEAYLDGMKPGERENWRAIERRVSLSESQRELVRGFTREVNILVSSGAWCGDCVQQCPILAVLAAEHEHRVRLRFVDRDEHADLAERVMLCGGLRVPVVIFMNEDFDLISLSGDRCLTRYRAMAAAQLGASCPMPGAEVPAEQILGETSDWCDELERAHLMCRLSTKLRARHGD